MAPVRRHHREHGRSPIASVLRSDSEEERRVPVPNLSRYSPNPPAQLRLRSFVSASPACELETSETPAVPLSPTVVLKDAILESLRKKEETKRTNVVIPERRTINHAKELNQKLSEVSEENFRLKLKIYFLEEENKHSSKHTKNDVVQLNVDLEHARQELKNKDRLLEETLQYLSQAEKRNEQWLLQNNDHLANISVYNTSQRISDLEKQILAKEEELAKSKRHLIFIGNTCNSLMNEMISSAKHNDWDAVDQLKDTFNQAFQLNKGDEESQSEKDLQQELNRKTEELKSLQEEISSRSEQLKSTLDDNSLSSCWSNDESLPKDLELELNTLHRAVQMKDSENRALMAERNELLNESKCRAETFMNLVEDRNTQIDGLQMQLESLKAKCLENQEAFRTLETEQGSLQKRLDFEIAEKKRIIGEAEVLDQTQMENMVELSKIKKEKLELEIARSELGLRLKEQERMTTEKDEQLRTMEGELVKLRGEHERVSSELDRAQKELFLVQRKVSSDAKDDLISALKVSIGKKDGELASITGQLSALRLELERTKDGSEYIVQSLHGQTGDTLELMSTNKPRRLLSPARGSPKSEGDVGCQMGELFVLRKKYKEAADRISVLEDKLRDSESLMKDYDHVLESFQKEGSQLVKPAGLGSLEQISTGDLKNLLGQDYSHFGKSGDVVQLKEEICMLVLRLQQLEDRFWQSKIQLALSSSKLDVTGIDHSLWEPSAIVVDSPYHQVSSEQLSSRARAYLETGRSLWLYIRELEEFLEKLLSACGNTSVSFMYSSQLKDAIFKTDQSLMHSHHRNSFIGQSFLENESANLVDFSDSVAGVNRSERSMSLMSFLSHPKSSDDNGGRNSEHQQQQDETSEGVASNRVKPNEISERSIPELERLEKAIETLSEELGSFQNGTAKTISQFFSGSRLAQGQFIIDALSSHLQNLDLKMAQVRKLLEDLKQSSQSGYDPASPGKQPSSLAQQERSLIQVLSIEPTEHLKKMAHDFQREVRSILKPTIEYLKSLDSSELDRLTSSRGLSELFELANSDSSLDEKDEQELWHSFTLWSGLTRTLFDVLLESLQSKTTKLQDTAEQLEWHKTTERERLNGEVERLNSQLDTVLKELEKSASNMNELMSDRECILSKTNQLEGELKESLGKSAQLQEDCILLGETLHAAKKELKDRTKELDLRVAELNKLVGDKEEEVVRLSQEATGIRKRLEELEATNTKLTTDLSQYKRRYKEAKECLKVADTTLKRDSQDLSPSRDDIVKENVRLNEEVERLTSTNSTLMVELRAYDLLSKQTETLLESAETTNNQVVQSFLKEMKLLKMELQKSIKANSKLNHHLANYSRQQSPPEKKLENNSPSSSSLSAVSTETLNGSPVAPPTKPVVAVSNPDWFSQVWNNKYGSQMTVAGSSSVSVSSSVFGMEKDLVSSAESLLHSRVLNQLGVSQDQRRRSTGGKVLDHMNDEPVRDVGSQIRGILSSVSAGSFSSQEDFYVHLEATGRSNYSSPDLGIESDPNQERGESTSSNASSIETTNKIVTAVGQQSHTANQISSMAQLRAVGRVEDFTLLNREVLESLALLEGVKSMVKGRLKTLNSKSPSKSLEYSTLKEVDSGCYKMQVCLKTGSKLIENFALVPLPNQIEAPPKANIATETDLQIDVYGDCQNCNDMDRKLNEALTRLARRERNSSKMEMAIAKRLTQTGKVLSQAKGNLLEENSPEKVTKPKPSISTAKKRIEKPVLTKPNKI